jgi:eukaryotic-like serine/threonine-protein kinase
MKSQHDPEQEQGGGPPAPPSLHPQDTVQEASGPPLQVFPHPPQRPPRPWGNPWVVLGAVILALALLASLGVLLIPGLLQHPTAPASTTATLPAATTPVPTTPGQTMTPAPATSPTTVPMPPTQKSCPPAGTARAAVMAPLVLGSHANLVYVESQVEGTNPTAGLLKRYDPATRSTTVMASVPSPIYEAQVSADGQWVLFTSTVFQRPAIQMVRMDGQGLQTLYCSARPGQDVAADLEWSPDQKYLAFTDGSEGVYLLTVATGAYRLEVPNSNDTFYNPRIWLDTTHLYLLAGPGEGGWPYLDLLDIHTGKVQQVRTLPLGCADFDSSIDGTQLFMSECVSGMGLKGPSSIRVQPATGGPTTTIYSTPTSAITYLRVASRTTLLFVISNAGVGSSDTSRNGVWKINIDGTGLTRLTTQTAGEDIMFNRYTQYVWSTVSRDGKSYAIEMSKEAGAYSRISSLLIGSMNGGPLVAFATQSERGSVAIVGWTSM